MQSGRIFNSKKLAIGSFGRRIQSRKGPTKAIKAMARKIAECYWRLMVKGAKYPKKGIIEYEKQLLLQKRKSAERLAKELNLKISEHHPVA